MLGAGYTIINNRILSLPKGTFKSFNIIEYNKYNDRSSMEADSTATHVSQGRFLKGGLVLKEE